MSEQGVEETRKCKRIRSTAIDTNRAGDERAKEHDLSLPLRKKIKKKSARTGKAIERSKLLVTSGSLSEKLPDRSFRHMKQ